MLEGIYLDLSIEPFSFLFLSLVWFIKENNIKMELRLDHIIDHLYNIFLEKDGSENCAQSIEEELIK